MPHAFKIIAVTAINWPGYTDFVKTQLGESPTRGLDKAGVELSDPLAFAYSLIPAGYNPDFPNRFSRHCSLTIITVVDSKLYTDILQFAPISIDTVGVTDQDDKVIAITINYQQVPFFFVDLSSISRTKALRIFLHEMFKYLYSNGFASVLGGVRTYLQNDETYLFRMS